MIEITCVRSRIVDIAYADHSWINQQKVSKFRPPEQEGGGSNFNIKTEDRD